MMMSHLQFSLFLQNKVDTKSKDTKIRNINSQTKNKQDGQTKMGYEHKFSDKK